MRNEYVHPLSSSSLKSLPPSEFEPSTKRGCGPKGVFRADLPYASFSANVAESFTAYHLKRATLASDFDRCRKLAGNFEGRPQLVIDD